MPDTLNKLLAPAGGGVYLVSTGLAETQALQRRIYGAKTNDELRDCWLRELQRLPEARVAVLGVPSDCGAGFIRGANQGPIELRKTMLANPDHGIHDQRVLDVGDVRVVPHLLSQGMVSERQAVATRNALYGEPGSALPVAPLEMCELALDELFLQNPSVIPIVLGGDHSVAWPAFSAAYRRSVDEGKTIGLLHFDAHTDLLEERLGVRYCFATWAYHANELLDRDGRLVQLGIRASGKTREHWESTLNVRQYWPEEVSARSTAEIIDEIIDGYHERGVNCMYVSNDIDGTDAAYASATGTPEGNGLSPEFVSEVTRRVLAEFPLVGADLVEVAPPLSGAIEGEPERTLATASRYLQDFFELALAIAE